MEAVAASLARSSSRLAFSCSTLACIWARGGSAGGGSAGGCGVPGCGVPGGDFSAASDPAEYEYSEYLWEKCPLS